MNLSASKLSMFAKCPEAFYEQYVLENNIWWSMWASLDFWKEVHDAIEKSLKNYDMLCNSVESLVSNFSSEVVPYVYSLHKNITQLKIDPSSMELEKRMVMNFHWCRVNWYMDYVDDNKIIDWKTSSGRMDMKSAMWYRIQAVIYYLYEYARTWKWKPVYFVSFNKNLVYNPDKWKEWPRITDIWKFTPNPTDIAFVWDLVDDINFALNNWTRDQWYHQQCKWWFMCPIHKNN